MKKIFKKIFFKMPNWFKTFFIFNFSLPEYFIIEPANICNIKCTACPWHTVMKREKKILKYEEFLVIYKKIKKHAKQITFYMMGEPLVNKDLFKMIEICERDGIYTNIATNGMLVEECVDSIFSSGLSSIKIALDGLTEGTHEVYRVGSDVEKIKRGIIKLGEEKRKRKIGKPHIVIQTLVNKLNQDKLDDIKEFIRPYADGFILKKMHLGRSEEQKEANLHFETDLGEFRREKLGKQGGYYKDMPYCHHISSLVVLSNGQVTQCCFDFDGEVDYGNLLHDSYDKVIKSEIRKKFIQSFFSRTNKLCRRCDFLAGMVRDIEIGKQKDVA